MSVIDDACTRWVRLSDREALGEELALGEIAFVREHARSCDECRREANLWQTLGSLVDGHGDLGKQGQNDGQLDPTRERTSALDARPRVRWPWLVGAATLAAAAAAALVVTRAPRHDEQVAPAPSIPSAGLGTEDVSAVLTMTSGGPIEIDGRPGVVGERLTRGSQLFARHGSACVILHPNIHACVARGSALRMADLGAHRRLELSAGRVSVELDPLPPGSSFGIATRHGTAIAIGTAFSVEVPPDDAPVITRVLHGKVLVRANDGSERRVAAHEKTSMYDAAPSALPAADEERDRALLGAPRHEGETAPVQLDSDVPGAIVTIDERVVGITPIALLVSRGDHSVSVAAASRGTMRETLHVGAEPLIRRFELPPATVPAGSTKGADLPKSASQLLVEVRERRARGDLDGTMAAYRELFDRHRTSAEAHAALVPWGELLLTRMADPEGALASFDRYLAQGGPLEEEATFGRIRALRALGRSQHERSAIEAFLRRFPEGPLAPSLRERLRSIDDR